MNNTLHIKVSNAPPLARQKLKGKMQKSWILNLDSCVFIARGRQLLYLRDGSSTIRDPIKVPDQGRYIPAQTQNYFVRLCVLSVNSVVKINTTEQQLSTGQHKAIIILNTKDSPQALHGSKPHAGGEFLNSAMGFMCKKVISVQSKLAVCNLVDVKSCYLCLAT